MTVAKSDKFDLFQIMWKNLDEFYKYNQEVGKVAQDVFKKQQELISAIHNNYSQLDEELKNVWSYDESNVNFEKWNESLKDLSDRLQKFAQTPTKVTTEFIEKTNEEMFTITKRTVEEQNKLQTKALSNIESYLNQFIEKQRELIKKLEVEDSSVP